MAIYMDHSATSFPKPECVYAEINRFMRENGVSPGRGTYDRAVEAEQLVYDTRKALCELLGVKRPVQIVFTSNATEALNLALKGFLREGDTVLTSHYEHNAMWRPLKTLERDRGIRIRQLSGTPDGGFDLDEVEAALRQGVRLFALVHGSNVIGSIAPLEKLAEIAKKHGVPVLVDAAQTAGVYPIDFSALGIDMLAFTGHKGLLGPTGTGGLCLREGLELGTYREGGTGSMAVSPFQPEDAPDRYEAGTMNIFGLAGLRASVRYLLEAGIEGIRRHEVDLMAHLLQGLSTIPNLIAYGPEDAEQRLGLVSINIEGEDPYKVARDLDHEYGIMVRAGLHCAPQAHMALGTETSGTVRVSMGYHNTLDEVDHLIHALRNLAQ